MVGDCRGTPEAEVYTYRDRVHGLEVAPELLSGLDEQALNGCLLGTKVIYLVRGKEKTTDPVLPQAGHLSGHYFSLSQVLLWLPWACRIKSGPSDQSWSPLSL